jgi:hypothetical protein
MTGYSDLTVAALVPLENLELSERKGVIFLS